MAVQLHLWIDCCIHVHYIFLWMNCWWDILFIVSVLQFLMQALDAHTVSGSSSYRSFPPTASRLTSTTAFWTCGKCLTSLERGIIHLNSFLMMESSFSFMLSDVIPLCMMCIFHVKCTIYMEYGAVCLGKHLSVLWLWWVVPRINLKYETPNKCLSKSHRKLIWMYDSVTPCHHTYFFPLLSSSSPCVFTCDTKIATTLLL